MVSPNACNVTSHSWRWVVITAGQGVGRHRGFGRHHAAGPVEGDEGSRTPGDRPAPDLSAKPGSESDVILRDGDT